VYSTDKITIDTPEQITLEFALAGIGSRFLALTLDTLLQGVLYLLVVLIAVFVPPLAFAWIAHAWAPAIAIFLAFCIYWGYFAAFEVLWHGQTPGKRIVGIRVVKDSGRPINAIEGIGRNLMRAVDGFLLYAVGLVCMMISRQNRRLGDYVAGTLVVHDKKTAEVKPAWDLANTAISTSSPELGQLSEEDLVVLETYLHRRMDLDPMVRVKTAIQVSALVERKTGLKRRHDQSDDDFLETIARETRDQARFRSAEAVNHRHIN
jgi:uncharacterized RDD family membrane protein YckC